MLDIEVSRSDGADGDALGSDMLDIEVSDRLAQMG